MWRNLFWLLLLTSFNVLIESNDDGCTFEMIQLQEFDNSKGTGTVKYSLNVTSSYKYKNGSGSSNGTGTDKRDSVQKASFATKLMESDGYDTFGGIGTESTDDDTGTSNKHYNAAYRMIQSAVFHSRQEATEYNLPPGHKLIISQLRATCGDQTVTLPRTEIKHARPGGIAMEGILMIVVFYFIFGISQY